MEKIAVIDIGSNSSKLLVASVMGKEKIEGLLQKTIPFRLSNQISKIHNFELQEDVLHLLLGVIDELASDARERDP